jgi:hypothetical protein
MLGGAGAFIGRAPHGVTMDGGPSSWPGAFRGTPKSREAGQLQLTQRVYGSYARPCRRRRSRPRGSISSRSATTRTTTRSPGVVEHGFNVVCDKPMTTSLEDARALRDLVRGAGTAFVLTHNYTGYPMVKEARHRIATGELGRINKVVVEYPQGWLSQLVEGGTSGINMWRMDPRRRPV